MCACIYVSQEAITPPCLNTRICVELPAAATDSQALWFLHNSPHYERLMQQHVLSGYDMPSEIGPNSHTTIIVPSGRREPAYIYDSFSSVNSRCPGLP
ncbi:hypothetical protein AVEN_128218-1 [Araneus ventricosus]|uniref:Uncharacterized protein n=1 Tax=Araneus ventricosus TaxID=182803 RepID=A0A4Y2A0I0_ARAVE|nr:hypothetical protein AVEN_128218-1 [Araneus ventricosus]